MVQMHLTDRKFTQDHDCGKKASQVKVYLLRDISFFTATYNEALWRKTFSAVA